MIGVQRLLVWIVLLGLLACNKSDTIQSKRTGEHVKNAIWPLGASRVEGNPNDYYSYRYDLWKMLLDSGWIFDYVGTQTDEFDYPKVNGNVFDSDHQGHGGWTSQDILEHLDDWIHAIDTPDIVLISSPGGNDALEGLSMNKAISNIEKIIQKIQSYNSHAMIIIEKMAPARSDLMNDGLGARMTEMNTALSGICVELSNDKSTVLQVDMLEGFNDDFLADDVHYNKLGAKFIASNYYETLKKYLER